jgi:lysophospholipase L1-like esterase
MEHLGVQPDLVTILIGSNDTLRKKYRAGLPAAISVLLQRLPPGTAIANLRSGHEITAAVNALMDQAVRDRGLVLADMRAGGPVSRRGQLAEDHFHPNDSGYTAIAAAFADGIAKLRRSGDPGLSGLGRLVDLDH